MLSTQVVATLESMTRASTGKTARVPVTLSWTTPHSHWGCALLAPVADGYVVASIVAEETGTQSKYALGATVLGGHAVQVGEVELSCIGPEGAT